MPIDPKVFRAAWRSCRDHPYAHGYKTPSKRNARWLIDEAMIEASSTPAGPYDLDPPMGVGRAKWVVFVNTA